MVPAGGVWVEISWDSRFCREVRLLCITRQGFESICATVRGPGTSTAQTTPIRICGRRPKACFDGAPATPPIKRWRNFT
jgi:hypothetical protein